MEEKVYCLNYENYKHCSVDFSLKANIALKLLTSGSSLYQWRVDGEDTSGRSKARPADPEELVSYVVKVAELLDKAFVEKGWYIENPLPKKVKIDSKI